MSIESSLSKDGKELTISINERFDLKSHHRFVGCYRHIENPPVSYVVDFEHTSYMDSTSLGLLLMLREHAGGDNSRIKFINVSVHNKQIIKTANFDQLFTIVCAES